ncbi:MAG: hypothetical protein C0497_04015 [Gemmatimonas sp.]|nr:hypothetical protein [Gemmatimonas sp.]
MTDLNQLATTSMLVRVEAPGHPTPPRAVWTLSPMQASRVVSFLRTVHSREFLPFAHWATRVEAPAPVWFTEPAQPAIRFRRALADFDASDTDLYFLGDLEPPVLALCHLDQAYVFATNEGVVFGGRDPEGGGRDAMTVDVPRDLLSQFVQADARGVGRQRGHEELPSPIVIGGRRYLAFPSERMEHFSIGR